MRVLIVHHGSLPGPSMPVTGGALRAWHHGCALQAAGHEVHWLSRAQDQAGGFSSPVDLQRQADRLQPERIVCVQPEDAPPLSALGVPLAIDLYAPRLLEAPFQGTLTEEAVRILQALRHGDAFLVSNPRQRWSWLGVLALANIDIRSDPTLLVPLVAPEGPTRPAPPPEPVLVAGGAAWPWLDPRPALERVLGWLDRRGEGRVIWYGGAPLLGDAAPEARPLPEHPRLEQPGWLPYPTLLERYTEATAAIDWLGTHPERQLALAFRHVDYLGCGLPILTGPDTALSDVLGRAGWAGENIEALLEKACDPAQQAKASRAAHRLARGRFGRKTAEAPLVHWVASAQARQRPTSTLLDAAALAARASAAETQARATQAALERALEEVQLKRAENERLTTQVQELISTTARLGRAMDEVAGFKREAITVLSGQSDRAQRSHQELEREVGILRADAAKKSAELRAMDELRARLEHDLDNLRAELERARQSRLFRR